MDIIVGLSSRAEGRAALDRAIEEAELRSARLHVVRTMGEGMSENPTKTRAWLSELEEAQREGDEIVERLAQRGVEATFRLDSVSTSPAAALLDLAREVSAHLIVLGIRRRSPVGKLVLGSVSQDVLLGADCPVLAVKASEAHAE